MNTLQDIVETSEKIEVQEKEKPLPIEAQQDSLTVTAELFPELAKKFRILSTDYQQITYYDKELKVTLPKFVTLDIESDGIFRFNDASDFFERGFGKLEKGSMILNPAVFLQRVGVRSTWKNIFLLFPLLTPVKSYEFQFKGRIPDKTRKIYKKYKQEFDDVYLICDAENQWKADTRINSIPVADPIMVGARWREIRENVLGGKIRVGIPCLFIVDVFDLTFDENYLTKEFTSSCQENPILQGGEDVTSFVT